jgi:hypothetical protein
MVFLWLFFRHDQLNSTRTMPIATNVRHAFASKLPGVCSFSGDPGLTLKVTMFYTALMVKH